MDSPASQFYKLSGGIFESMFNGIGGELLFRPYDKNYGVGLGDVAGLSERV